jgi:hypothetical protein
MVPSDLEHTRRRAGVLTLHYGCNHGAQLQALATARLFGGEIVDHRYKRKVELFRGQFERRPWLKESLEKGLPLSDYKCISSDFHNEATWDHINRTYDLLVCGSDELWKVQYRSSSPRRELVRALLSSPYHTFRNYARLQRDPWWTPYPNVYWAEVDVPSIAFAVSMGETNLSEVPDRHVERMRRCLGRYRWIGVRDEHTRRTLLGIDSGLESKIVPVPDPVFTYAVDEGLRERVRLKLAANGLDVRKPLCFVHGSTGVLDPFAAEIKRLGFEPIDLFRLELTPTEWFAAIGMVRCGITSVMHAFVCSLVQNVPCLSVDPRRKSAELRERFGVERHATLQDCLDRWPGNVPAIAAEFKSRVEEFVREARRCVERPARATDHAESGWERGAVGGAEKQGIAPGNR